MTSPLDVKNQVAPCGITCGTCDLGNGTAAGTAKKTKELIYSIGIKDWAPAFPGGAGLDWEATEKTLEWMTKYAYCGDVRKEAGHRTAPSVCAPKRRATGSATSAMY